MIPAEMLALVKRLRFDPTPIDRDLAHAADLIERMAQVEPIHVYEWDTYGGGVHRSFGISQWNGRGPDRAVLLYTHPAPQPQPERQPVSEPTYSHPHWSKCSFNELVEGICANSSIYGEQESAAFRSDLIDALHRAQMIALEQCKPTKQITERHIAKAYALCPSELATPDRYRWMADFLNKALAAPQPVSEPTRSEQLRAAGFTRRDDRIECDECGKRYSPQMLPIHKCEPTEAQIEAKARELCRQEAEVDFDFDFHWAERAEEFRAAARAALAAQENTDAAR